MIPRHLMDLLPDPYQGWRALAECIGAPDEVFFTDDQRGQEKRDNDRQAKRICARCLVRVDCLTYALTRGERYGTWGGMTARERREYARRTAPAQERAAV